MANAVQTNFTHTYAGDFTKDLFFAPQEMGDNIFENYRVMPNVVNDKIIYIPDALSKVLKKATGCGYSSTGNTTISDRKISVEDVEIELDQCWTEFKDTIWEEAFKQGVDISDLQDTVIADIMQQKAFDAFRTDAPRIQWFAKSGHSDDDYDHFDGWIQLAFDTSANLGHILDMDTTSHESGGTLQADGALGILKNLWENQSATLRDVPVSQKRLYVSDTVADNLRETYEDTQSGEGLLRQIEGGGLEYRGIPVIEVSGWATALADADNPQKSIIGNNLVVLTIPDNLIVGTNVTDPGNQMVTWYEIKDEKIYLRMKYKQGAQIMHPEYMSLAY